jgi:cyclopropane fatty-acyl-phospholipid synthase-like methyltransferase
VNGWIDPVDYGPHSRQHLGHTFRYGLARGFIQPSDRVLDAACGCGYGAQILSQRAGWVYGLDVDDEALTRARDRYDAPSITWERVDLDRADTLPAVDVAVSFETVEHLEYPERFVTLLREATDRLMILSAPVIPTVGTNKHHKHDFSEESFRALVLNEDWTLYEQARQGPYLILVAYQSQWPPILTGKTTSVSS